MKAVSSLLLASAVVLMVSSDAFMMATHQSQLTRTTSAIAYSSSVASFPMPTMMPQQATTTTATPKRNTINAPGRPDHIQEVLTMDDYNEIVKGEKDHMVVVRFYAPWCRACKAMAPSYYKFTNELKNTVKFVDCPLTSVNSKLHTQLGISSIPSIHVYHPQVGLVEERKVSRKYYSSFEQSVKTYLQDSCVLSYNDDCQSPWHIKEQPQQPEQVMKQETVFA